MKKFFLFLLMGFLLAITSNASADSLGTGTLYVNWGGPTYTSHNYLLNYYGKTYTDVDEIITGSIESIFCVSPNDAHWKEDVEIYSLDSLDDLLPNTFTNILKAAWIADNYMSLGYEKYEAQVAIWDITGVVGLYGDAGTNPYYTNASTIIGKANTYFSNNNNTYSTDSWALAISGSYPGSTISANDCEANYQDYLVPMNPVPEPATMLLLGTGLIGLTGLRRKFKK